MPTLTFYIEGEHSDLEWVRTRIDGAIHEIIDEAEDENRLDGSLGVDWEYDD